MIIKNPEFLVLLPLLLLTLKLIPRGSSYTRKVAAARSAVILLLVLAAASPAIMQVQEATSEQKLNVMIDNTTSMQVAESQEIPVEGTETVFVQGNNSKIFSQASTQIEEGSYNLLVTDGQTDEEVDELVKTAEEKNATVSVYRPDTQPENAVRIEGPSTTVPGAQNTFEVKISSTWDNSVPVNVTLDNEVVFSGRVNESHGFNREFDSEGEHTIQAHIVSNDTFQENNHYYKTVDVREKPKILSVGESGTLERNLEKFYRIENRGNLPRNLDDYYSIILKKPMQSNRLENYIADGNGLTYTGKMRGEVPDYLPVRASSQEEDDSGARVIILIDASFGTGNCESQSEEEGSTYCWRSGSGGQAKESIRIAYSLVDGLKKNNKVGVVAYNSKSFLISEPKSLAFNRETIKDKISRISPEGLSFHDLGIRGAAQMAEENDTVVMLSDGKLSGYYNRDNVAFKTRTEANTMEAKLITVGMGEEPNEPLLEDIAETTGGYYLENDEAGRLEFKFGAGGGESEYTPISVVNPDHFITEGIELEGSTTGFKSVDTKRSGKTLVSGSNGKEFLSTWRYGLGRVAAFSAGDRNLDRTSKSDPALVSRTVSWTVGNPQRKKDRWLEVEDASMPEAPEARASYQEDGLTRESSNLYTGELERPGLGLHTWRNESYAYNYNPEIRSVGVDQSKLSEIAQKTGGKIFDRQNIDEIEKDLSEIDRKVEQQVSLSPFLIAAALLVFLIEVGYRKMNGRM